MASSDASSRVNESRPLVNVCVVFAVESFIHLEVSRRKAKPSVHAARRKRVSPISAAVRPKSRQITFRDFMYEAGRVARWPESIVCNDIDNAIRDR